MLSYGRSFAVFVFFMCAPGCVQAVGRAVVEFLLRLCKQFKGRL